MKRDAEENKKAAAELTAEARAKAEVGAEKATDALANAGDATADAARRAVATAGAAVETMDVKAALIADKRVSAKDINVDTDRRTMTVVLKGHVPTEAQKTIAEQIAAAKAPGYRVKNELKVG